VKKAVGQSHTMELGGNNSDALIETHLTEVGKIVDNTGR